MKGGADGKNPGSFDPGLMFAGLHAGCGGSAAQK